LVTTLPFFFQAEDGIRDLTVTGVQTCALPILVVVRPAAHVRERETRTLLPPTLRLERLRDERNRETDAEHGFRVMRETAVARPRSEERRVGKECRGRGGEC